MSRSLPAIVRATVETALENALAAGHGPDVAVEWVAKVTRLTWPDSDPEMVRRTARRLIARQGAGSASAS